jgi:DNA-nicking Smr family endonuclease
MMRRRGSLTEQERYDWAVFARQITPLRGRVVPTLPEVQPVQDAMSPPPPASRSPLPPPPRPHPAPPLDVGATPAGLDGSTWNRFRAGRVAPVRTLDLHGRTAQRAFHALHAFLNAAHADRVRCVEVITGRGSAEGGGVLRRELPIWLNLPELRPLVLAAAHPHPANSGAVRLLLRRLR